MTETTNYSLKKPDPSDRVLIADLNENSDKIDAELKKNADTIQSVSNKADENERSISELQSKSETAESEIESLKKKDTQTDVAIQGIDTRVKSAEDWIKGMQNPLVIKGTVASVADLDAKTSEAKAGWIYFVGNDSEEKNKYEEYVFTEDKNWERIGSAKIDLSQYVTLDNFNAELENKADVSALSDYVKTEKLTDVFKTYGIENEQEVPILKQTIGYESRNLFDFDSWYASIKRIQGTGSSFSKSDNGITITSGQSTDAYTFPYGSPEVDGNALPFYIKVQPNTKYILSFTATGQLFNVYVFFFTDTGIHYFSEPTASTTETVSFTTPKDTKYISVRLAVTKENTSITFSNIQLQLANAQTDDTYQPYTPTVNDRLLALENLDAPVIAKKYKLNNAISFEDGKLGQRVFQEKIPVSVDGYTPVCSSLSYVVNSNMYNIISFISGDYSSVYVNAYAATNEAHTDSVQCAVTVTFISNDYYQGTSTDASDEPENDEEFSPRASYTNEESANYEE